MSEPNSRPDFASSGLEFTGDFVGLGEDEKGNKKVWTRSWWDSAGLRCLRRNVPAGLATINECHGTGGNFILKIQLQQEVIGADIEATLFFETLLAAAEVAETFAWNIKEQGDYKWYQTACRTDFNVWHAVVGEGDRAHVSCNSRGEYHMKREIQVRKGEWYEITAHRYSLGEDQNAVTTFAEAAAIAITLPAYLAVLGARS